MTVLVTGGLGVNGAWVTRKLLGSGAAVVVVDHQTDRSLLGTTVAPIQILQIDIQDNDAMRHLLSEHKVQCIVHMAALISGLDANPLAGFQVNALSTVQLLDAALSAGVKRFVYTSSRAVYGNIKGEHAYPAYTPITEDHCLAAENVYDVTKLAGELMGRSFAKLGLEFVALRFATIFGPGKLARHGAMGIYSRLIENAMAGAPIEIARGGEERDDVLYVDDVAQACVLAATHPRPNYNAYNISRGVGTTLRDFANELTRQLPRTDVSIGPGLNYFGTEVNYSGVLDNSRAVRDLKFTPQFDLAAGIADYIAKMSELRLSPTVT